MGMYTELLLKCSIKPDIPEDVHNILLWMFGEVDNKWGSQPTNLPSHEFFTKPRWHLVGASNSYYNHPKTINSIEYDATGRISYLFSRSDLKDYDAEIASFIDWVKPYLDNSERQCIGWTWYEEDVEPTLIIM